MFDYFYGAGGRIFDTAYIYNNGLGDKYLGDWINSRNLQNDDRCSWKGRSYTNVKPELIKASNRRIIRAIKYLKNRYILPP